MMLIMWMVYASGFPAVVHALEGIYDTFKKGTGEQFSNGSW